MYKNHTQGFGFCSKLCYEEYRLLTCDTVYSNSSTLKVVSKVNKCLTTLQVITSHHITACALTSRRALKHIKIWEGTSQNLVITWHHSWLYCFSQLLI